MNKFNIRSLGELEGMMNEQKYRYEKYRDEVNRHVEEYNKMVSLLEQSEQYYELAKKSDLSASEQNMISICRQAMHNNGLLTLSDVDALRERARISGNKIAALKEKLEGCKQR